MDDRRTKLARALYESVRELNYDISWSAGYVSEGDDLAHVTVDGGVDFLALANIALREADGTPSARDKALEDAAALADNSLILLTGPYERMIMKGVASAIRLSKGQTDGTE